MKSILRSRIRSSNAAAGSPPSSPQHLHPSQPLEGVEPEHEELYDEVHGETFMRTQTDHDDEVRGMKRKWDRHFYGKIDIIAQSCLIMGVLLGIVGGMLWVQYLFIWSFDSTMIFDRVLDQNDQWALDQTYLDFIHKDVEMQTSLFSVYLWNVTNAEILLREGFKPYLSEAGPFGYVKNTWKYDVVFTPDSHFVTYKQYNYYTPTPNPADCYHMFFRMDKAIYSSQEVDCSGTTCHCVDDEQQVNVINPKFFDLLGKWKPAGIMGLLSQEIFQEYKDVFTTSFINSVKYSFLPKFMRSVFNFRNQNYAGQTFGTLINNLVAAKGEAWVIEHFRYSHLEDKLPSTTCGDINVPSDKSLFCPFGSGNFIASFAQTSSMALTERESRILLNLDHSWPDASPFNNGDAGILRWINAAVYLELIEETLLDIDIIRQDAEDAFWEISNECETWDGASDEHCYFKIKGMCELLFNMWTWAPYNKNQVINEWKTAPLNSVKCDTRGNTCEWELERYNTNNLPLEVASDFLDPYRAATWNHLSLYKEENINNFKNIYDHCTFKAAGKPHSCPAMYTFEVSATSTYPALFNTTTLKSERVGRDMAGYESMGCSLANWLFEGWGQNNNFVNAAVATWFNARWPSSDDMYGKWTPDNLSLLGYAQWGNGVPTKLMYKVPSTTNLKRLGIWRFSKKGTQLNLPEYYSRTQKWAYPEMNMTTLKSQRILDVLSEDSYEAYELRRHIMHAGTTAYGDGVNFMNGFGAKGETGFVLENAYANFTLPEDHVYYDVSEWMDISYTSSPQFCAVIDEHYQKCQQEIDKFKMFWPSRCSEWKTLKLDPAFGIQCNDVRIWANSHPYPKKNGNVVEAIITEVLWEEVLRKQLLVCSDPDYVHEPNGGAAVECSYDKGGMFINQKARDIIFEGYTDPFTIKVMNSQYKMEKRGFQIVCNNQVEVSFSWQCAPVYDPQCGEGGFSVIHETQGVLKNMTRNTVDWYLPEIELEEGFGTIDNPVFAAYAGALWKDKALEADTNVTNPTRTVESARTGSVSAEANFNVTENEDWQKERNCMKRYLNGPKDIYPNCTITMETGRGDLERLGKVVNYFGNDTLVLYGDNTLKVDGNFAAESDYNNFLPLVWEAYREYNLHYQNRYSGLSYKGNSTLTVLVGDEMVQFKVPNVEKWDGKSPSKIRWPMRYRFIDNSTQESQVFLLRYEVGKESWDDNRYGNYTADDAPEYDYYGMPFNVPEGMSSTRAQSGFSTMIGTPHHYGNELWGGSDWVQIKGMDPDPKKHSFYFDLEPISGQMMRIAKRLQLNVRVERGPLLESILSSQERCPVPNKGRFNLNGYGCFIYFPFLWYDDQRVFEQKKTLWFQDNVLSCPLMIAEFSSGTITMAVVLGVSSLFLWVRQIKKYRDFKKRIFLE